MIGILADTDDNCHKRWCRHFVCIYIPCKLYHVSCTGINMIFSSQLHLKQSVASITTMQHRITFKATAVSVMIKLAVQGFCIHTQVSYGHILKEKAECV